MLTSSIFKRLFSTARHSHFATINDNDLSFFRATLGDANVYTGEDVEPYNVCFLGTYKGHSKVVVKPSTTQHISKILNYCNSRRLAVVPQGGNTGLVGGSVPVFDQVIMSMRGLHKIQQFDAVSGVLSCQAGCVLEKLNEFLQPQGFEVPLDLGAKGSCLIGGNAATHAGGKYFIKHGPLRAHILGMEAVLADGTVLDMRSRIRKDNTGPDIKQLMIGAEGTLGVITKLDINCMRIDEIRKVLLFKTDNYATILEAVKQAKSLGKQLSALEYMDGYSYHAVTKHLHPEVMPVKESDHLLLIEVNTEDIQPLIEKLPEFQDSIMSNNDKEYKSIWKIREDIALAANKMGTVHSYDISFDVHEWDDFVKKARSRFGGYVIGYGHIGDSNLHLNICLEKDTQLDEKDVFMEVVKKHGSISAEHGIGAHKTSYLGLQKPQEVLNLLNQIKKVFDPHGILNPYKVYPAN